MDFSTKSDDDCLALARIAEAAERYDDMCKAMKALVAKKGAKGLIVEERNLLSVAYKNVVGAKRSSWRTLSAGTFEQVNPELVQKFTTVLEKELEAVCKEVIDILDGLLKSLETAKKEKDETTVFYLKMKGDYYRYLSEFQSDSAEHKTSTSDCYKEAMNVAETVLPETHPTRLGLALNYSVCFYEILKKPEEACALAKKAFDAAIEKLDTLNDASYKDSTLIMQLLRDNLTLWTSETQDAGSGAADGPEDQA